MGRHSMEEEPPPPSGRRLATGGHPAVDTPVRGADEPALRPPAGRGSTGHPLAVEAKAVMGTPPCPPDRRVATGRYPAVDPVADAPARQPRNPAPQGPDGRVTTGRRPAVDAPTRQVENPAPRRPGPRTTGRQPAIDAPLRQPRNPAPRRPDGRTATGQHAPVDTPTRQVKNPAPPRPDGRVATGRRPAVDAPTRQVKNPAPQRPDGRTASGQHAAVDAPTRQVKNPAPERSDGRTATGHHRAVGAAASRRRIAKWPIVSGVLVLLIALGLGGWAWANKVLDKRDAAQAKDCAEGVSTMKVIAAPGIAHPVQTAAEKWNQARTVVHAHCVTIEVQPRPSDQVLDALTGRTGPEAIGGIPAAWIPEVAGNWAAQLTTARPDLVGSPPEGLTNDFSYVGLGGKAVDEVAVRAAQVFRDFLLAPAQRPAFTDAGLA
jgi:hypothetical protein